MSSDATFQLIRRVNSRQEKDTVLQASRVNFCAVTTIGKTLPTAQLTETKGKLSAH